MARRLTWMDRWQELAGFARFEALRSDDAALRYVTKYVFKVARLSSAELLGVSLSYHWSTTSSGPRESPVAAWFFQGHTLPRCLTGKVCLQETHYHRITLC